MCGVWGMGEQLISMELLIKLPCECRIALRIVYEHKYVHTQRHTDLLDTYVACGYIFKRSAMNGKRTANTNGMSEHASKREREREGRVVVGSKVENVINKSHFNFPAKKYQK